MQLKELAESSWEDMHFTTMRVPIGDKMRTLSIPSPGMRRLHADLLDRLKKIPELEFSLFHSFGALNGRSAIENASWHARCRHFYQLDIKDAYPSVPLERLAKCLRYRDPTLGSIAEISAFLEEYCAGPNGGLAVGAPASPALFDLYCAHSIDFKIRGCIEMSDTVYTRYLDDLTISSNRPIPSILRQRIRAVVTDAGFSINHRKSSVRDREFARVPITGALITKQGCVHPTDEHLARLQALMRPPHTSKRAREFAGLACYLRTFEVLADEGRTRMSSRIARLLAKARRHLRQLPSQGLLPRQYRKTLRFKFPERLLQDIRNRVNLVEFASRYQKFKKYGREYVGLSPFTKEKTPSCYLVPEKGFWHDFSSGRHGDVFTLYMHFESCDFPHAVRKLAAECGVPVPD